MHAPGRISPQMPLHALLPKTKRADPDARRRSSRPRTFPSGSPTSTAISPAATRSACGLPVRSGAPARSCHSPQGGRPRGSVPIPSGSSPASLTRIEDAVASSLPRKEVIQPQLPLRLPCYDFVPITSPALDGCPPANRVGPPASGVAGFRDVTGGVYKAREHIHRGSADPRLLATPSSRGRVAAHDPN